MGTHTNCEKVMSSIWARVSENTPQIDCGLCGRFTCASFARSVIVGDMDVDSCPILYLQQFGDFQKRFSKNVAHRNGLNSRPAPELPKDGIILAKPCQEGDKRLVAEFRVFNGVAPGSDLRFPVFDPTVLCEALDYLRNLYQDVSCSRDLGYGRFTADSTNITILQDGRINIRRVLNKARANKMFASIERFIIASVICNCCGCDLLSVLARCSLSKTNSHHPVLHAGTRFSLDRKAYLVPLNRKKLRTSLGDEGSSAITVIDQIHKHIVGEVSRLSRIEVCESSEKPNFSNTKHLIFGLLNSISSKRHDTLVLNALAFIYAAANSMQALEDVECFMNTIDPRLKRMAIDMLAEVDGNTHSKYEPNMDSPEMLLIYAHIKRVERALALLGSWNS